MEKTASPGVHEGLAGTVKLDLSQVHSDRFTLGFECEMVYRPGYRDDEDDDDYDDDDVNEAAFAEALGEVRDLLYNYDIKDVRVLTGRDKNKNYAYWYVEPDGSIRPDDRGEVGVEIVSPAFRGLDAALAQLENCFGFIQENGYTNESTGLHVSVGFAGIAAVDRLKLSLLLGEKMVARLFGREHNTYAYALIPKFVQTAQTDPRWREVINRLQRSSAQDPAVLTSIGALVGDEKHRTINFGRAADVEAVEFRVAGGEGYEKKFSAVRDVIRRYCAALEAAADPQAYRREYLGMLARLLTGGPSTAEPADASYLDGAIKRGQAWIVQQSGSTDGMQVTAYRECLLPGSTSLFNAFAALCGDLRRRGVSFGSAPPAAKRAMREALRYQLQDHYLRARTYISGAALRELAQDDLYYPAVFYARQLGLSSSLDPWIDRIHDGGMDPYQAEEEYTRAHAAPPSTGPLRQVPYAPVPDGGRIATGA